MGATRDWAAIGNIIGQIFADMASMMGMGTRMQQVDQSNPNALAVAPSSGFLSVTSEEAEPEKIDIE
jgi:hypothetical protein